LKRKNNKIKNLSFQIPNRIHSFMKKTMVKDIKVMKSTKSLKMSKNQAKEVYLKKAAINRKSLFKN